MSSKRERERSCVLFLLVNTETHQLSRSKVDKNKKLLLAIRMWMGTSSHLLLLGLMQTISFVDSSIVKRQTKSLFFLFCASSHSATCLQFNWTLFQRRRFYRENAVVPCCKRRTGRTKLLSFILFFLLIVHRTWTNKHTYTIYFCIVVRPHLAFAHYQ